MHTYFYWNPDNLFTFWVMASLAETNIDSSERMELTLPFSFSISIYFKYSSIIQSLQDKTKMEHVHRIIWLFVLINFVTILSGLYFFTNSFNHFHVTPFRLIGEEWALNQTACIKNRKTVLKLNLNFHPLHYLHSYVWSMKHRGEV